MSRDEGQGEARQGQEGHEASEACARAGPRRELHWMNASFPAQRIDGGPFGGRRRPSHRVAAAVTRDHCDRCRRSRGCPAAAAAPAVVAQAKGKSSPYRSPRAKRPFARLANPSVGSPRVFLVKRRATGWEQVYLPRRPNGSTGWVRDAAVELALDPYRVVVSLGQHTLTVWRGGHVVHFERAGVGRSVMPTPTGLLHRGALQAASRDGDLRPVRLGLSAYSNVLYSFGGGPGQIGLHGTNEPGALGTNVSHGASASATPASPSSRGSCRSAHRCRSPAQERTRTWRHPPRAGQLDRA